jgi:Coenzyme PQQ synthesis protein D (PqqD)
MNLLTDSSVVSISTDQLVSKLGDEVIVLNMKSGVYYGLDAVGARVWELAQSPQTVKSLQETLLAEFDVDADRCRRDLSELLDHLRTEGLVHIQTPAAQA